MKRRYIAYALAAFIGIIFSGCSNLFENVINEDFSFKAGDDSLFVDVNREETQNGLVVIKASEKNKNQIKYSSKQKIILLEKFQKIFLIILLIIKTEVT